MHAFLRPLQLYDIPTGQHYPIIPGSPAAAITAHPAGKTYLQDLRGKLISIELHCLIDLLLQLPGQHPNIFRIHGNVFLL